MLLVKLFDEQGRSAAVNTKVYDVLHKVICYLHKQDKNHPVSYAFAGVDNQGLQIVKCCEDKSSLVSDVDKGRAIIEFLMANNMGEYRFFCHVYK